jgi:hypothetical protein
MYVLRVHEIAARRRYVHPRFRARDLKHRCIHYLSARDCLVDMQVERVSIGVVVRGARMDGEGGGRAIGCPCVSGC